MKLLFVSVLLAAGLQAHSVVLSAQESKQTISVEHAIDGPPSEGPSPKSASSTKPARRKSASEGRKAASPEVKSFAFSARERLARPLVVRTGQNDGKAVAQLQEDLAVMSRLLDKATAEFKDDHEEAAGIPIVALAGGRSVRAMYLEEYGAVFTMTVNIPLRAELKVPDQEARVENVANEEWNEARNEIFGDRRQTRVEKNPRREIDPHQFEEFRDALIDTLRNASNIRNLRSDDWITLVVRGRGFEEEIERRFDVFLQSGPGRDPVLTTLSADDRSPDISTLVLRVKKSDVDHLGKPATADEFRKKVSLALY
jgi:hypothetical protein